GAWDSKNAVSGKPEVPLLALPQVSHSNSFRNDLDQPVVIDAEHTSLAQTYIQSTEGVLAEHPGVIIGNGWEFHEVVTLQMIDSPWVSAPDPTAAIFVDCLNLIAGQPVSHCVSADLSVAPAAQAVSSEP